MRTELYTNKEGLVYQCGDEQAIAIDWPAARNGVEFNDEHHTRVRAFPTKSPYVGSIWVNQGGRGVRTFDLPVGVLIALDGPTIESAVGWEMVSSVWSDRLYWHKLSFEKASQVAKALDALSELRITVVDEIEVRPGRCKSLAFQTPYALGPLMCAVIHHATQPAFFMFNRDPRTWRRVPFLRRVTHGQAVLTLAMFTLFCGSALCGLFFLDSFISMLNFWNDMLLGLLFTILTAWVGPDVLGLVETARVAGARQAVNGSRKKVQA
jgi:hypothetical protein